MMSGWLKNGSIEMFKKTRTLMGVSPPPLRLPLNAMLHEQVIHHHREFRDGMGVQALSPSSIYVLSFIEKTGFSYENHSIQIKCGDCYQSIHLVR
jgi:hypothetical protein